LHHLITEPLNMMTTTQPTASVLKTATLTPKKYIRTALQNSSDARSTITTFQRNNSLHTMFANAFGTKPIHEKDDCKKVKVEPLDPSPVLEFLSHLNVSRHEVHSRVAAALRTAIEDEIQRMPLSSHSTSGGAGDNAPLLNLLKSVWQYRDIPELRPILVCLLKRLGDHTPVQILRRLGVKKTAENEGTKKNAELKNAELLSLLGPHMSRLVWEANWDEHLEAVTASFVGQKTLVSGPIEAEMTLSGPTILADLINPSVQNYLGDFILVQSADKCFVATTTSERRFNTKLRRTKAIDPGHASTSVVGALASIGVTKASEENADKSPIMEEKSIRASAEAISFIMDIIGSRPKLLGAVLDMLISEFAQNGGRLNRIASPTSDEKQQAPASTVISLLGGATNLSCSLVSDVLLSFGQLPRQYEMLGIMARILDDSVQTGSISDVAVAQVQGCLRSIFRPENTEQQAATSLPRSSEPGNSSLKIKLKAPSTFPDLPADDSQHEKKIIQRIVKAAIASLKTNDYQVPFRLINFIYCTV